MNGTSTLLFLMVNFALNSPIGLNVEPSKKLKLFFTGPNLLFGHFSRNKFSVKTDLIAPESISIFTLISLIFTEINFGGMWLKLSLTLNKLNSSNILESLHSMDSKFPINFFFLQIDAKCPIL